MITLNLISQDLKKKIKLNHIHIFLKKIDFILLISVILISITFLTTKLLLERRFVRVVEETTLINRSSQTYNNKVREINKKISIVSQVQNNFIYWSNLFKEIDKDLENNITLSYINADSTSGTIKIKGQAKTRDGLLAFRDALTNSKFFKDIVFPMSNILEKENIEFEINAKISLTELK